MPLWLQWVLPFSIAALLIIALVVFVHHETDDVPQYANTNSNAIVEQNREDTIIVRQQQAPRVSRLAAGVSATVGLRDAVDRYMTSQVNHGFMAGPLKGTVCHAVGGTSTRQVLKCDVTAADVTYPFDGVVAARVITYCQRVAPPTPSMNVPVSKRCI